LVELKLVLAQDVETLGKRKHVHHKEEYEALNADKHLRDVVHERCDAVDQAQEVAGFHVD